MPIIGTRTWWVKQFALLGVIFGVGLVAVAGLGYLEGGDLLRSALVALLGVVVTAVGAYVWKRYSNRDAVERLEQQIYGPE